MSTRAPIAVGPGRAVTAVPDRVRAERGIGRGAYPILGGKGPGTRAARRDPRAHQLLDWLETKIHSRVVFVIAERVRQDHAPCDFYAPDQAPHDLVPPGRTTIETGSGFLSHLVAAGRGARPGDSRRETAGRSCGRVGPGGPARDDAIETFLGELSSIAAKWAALIFDDFHLADEIADVRHIAREIVTRAPPSACRSSVASRRQPPVPVSKLRAHRASWRSSDRGDCGSPMPSSSSSSARTYGRPLEPDVLRPRLGAP
jgi:hypothetical protein